MANSYTVWRTGLETWIAAVLPTVPIVWENDPRPARLETPYLIAAGPQTLEQDGPDEVVYSDPAIPQVKAPRRAMYQLRIIQRTQVPAGQQAGYLMEVLRTSLAQPAVRRTFGDAGLGFARASSVRHMDEEWDQRMQSIASLDLWVNVVFDTSDLLGADEGVIETVGVTSALEPAETPPNVADLEIG